MVNFSISVCIILAWAINQLIECNLFILPLKLSLLSIKVLTGASITLPDYIVYALFPMAMLGVNVCNLYKICRILQTVDTVFLYEKYDVQRKVHLLFKKDFYTSWCTVLACVTEWR